MDYAACEIEVCNITQLRVPLHLQMCECKRGVKSNVCFRTTDMHFSDKYPEGAVKYIHIYFYIKKNQRWGGVKSRAVDTPDHFPIITRPDFFLFLTYQIITMFKKYLNFIHEQHVILETIQRYI